MTWRAAMIRWVLKITEQHAKLMRPERGFRVWMKDQWPPTHPASESAAPSPHTHTLIVTVVGPSNSINHQPHGHHRSIHSCSTVWCFLGLLQQNHMTTGATAPTLVLGQSIIIVTLCNRADHYIFILFLLLSFFPRLISAVGDWMSTILPHMVWP